MDDILNSDQRELLKRTRDVLGHLRDVLGELGGHKEDRDALAESMRQLDELFLLVVAGEFNAGKSSFINALLGTSLLTEGVTPTTSQIYLLRYGDKSEQKPLEKGIWEQTAPIDFLKQINIVDTPGTNAIMREHEALTAEFIPRSDLVLFVSSADRPFTESERSFLQQIRDWGKKIVLIINKKDILVSEADVNQIHEFVTHAARDLLGTVPAIFMVSAKQAQRAKAGETELLSSSGFEQMEKYIYDSLDDSGRFRLKLLNPLGVGQKLVQKQLDHVEADLHSLQRDNQLLQDIDGQMQFYNEDMQRNFESRLGEINNLLYEMEIRGQHFFDEHLRMARVPDLIRKERIRRDFEEQVVSNTPELIEKRVDEMIDWLVAQDLRQWSAVVDHMSKRLEEMDHRIVGRGTDKEGSLAYDRRRLVDSITAGTRRAIATFDKEQEAVALADSAREAVIRTGGALVGAGLGTALAMATTAVFFDVTGVILGVMGVALGLFILPARKRQAKQNLEEKMSDLRQRLLSSLTGQFEYEIQRSSQRIQDTIAPFTRFVRAENSKLQTQQEQLEELEAHITGLKAQVQA